ncbi:MAG TPA: hypothetical protein VJM31_13700 [Vicinamibacterales bacterium]|nr:hypothetical protein [Vicinamibacterales bacterium]
MLRDVVFNSLIVLGSVALLSACSGNSYCLVQKDYQKARVVPELRSTEGLAMPNSPTALRLPPEPASNEPFGKKDARGAGVCLDKPPDMAQPAAPLPEAKPAT